MIVHCTYEELSALSAGAHRALAAAEGESGAVAAPPEAVADIEVLLPRLEGDLSIETLEEQRSVQRAVGFVLSHLKERTDALIIEQYVGADDAVNSHFDYAHVLTIHDRLERLGDEMEAMIQVMSGDVPTPETARRITFPD